MPSTRSERQQEREEITTEVFGVVLGLLRKLIRFDDNVQTYVSIAGDDSAEMRRTVGLFAVQRERTIDLKIEQSKMNIESCHFYALSAIVPEERDIWFDRTKVHANRIKRLEVEKTAIKRILAMELPWPDLIRTALGVARTTGNTQLMDSTTYGAITEAISSMESSGTPPPPPPGSGATTPPTGSTVPPSTPGTGIPIPPAGEEEPIEEE